MSRQYSPPIIIVFVNRFILCVAGAHRHMLRINLWFDIIFDLQIQYSPIYFKIGFLEHQFVWQYYLFQFRVSSIYQIWAYLRGINAYKFCSPTSLSYQATTHFPFIFLIGQLEVTRPRNSALSLADPGRVKHPHWSSYRNDVSRLNPLAIGRGIMPRYKITR